MSKIYRDIFQNAVDGVRDEGRYRIFRDIRRKKGAFPQAIWYQDNNQQKEITVWCSNAVSYTHLTLPTKA